MVLRVLEGTGDGELDLSLREAYPEDRYLLCSDGLTAVVGPETLFNTLTEMSDPDEAARWLIDLANRGRRPRQHHLHRGRLRGARRRGPAGPPAIVGAAVERRLSL